MGMIIKVAYNNQNWTGRCRNTANNVRFYKCQEGAYAVGYKTDKNGNCLGEECWESTLCTKYFWGCNIGKFDKRAEGKVFFVFPDISGFLVLWGKSEVERAEGNKIYFKEFKAMPREKWVTNLTAEDILGKAWKQPPFRYLSSSQEDYLEGRIREKEL